MLLLLRRSVPQLLDIPLKPAQEFRDADSEGLGNHQQRQDRGVLQAPFDIPDKSPVQARAGSKILLRPTLLLPKLPDTIPERLLILFTVASQKRIGPSGY